MQLPILSFVFALLLPLIFAASNSTTLVPAANIEKHTLAPDWLTSKPSFSPPATARLNRILRPRDFVGGTNTNNPEPCSSKCRDSQIMNCAPVNYVGWVAKLEWQVHTWRCFCSDGAMCMGSKRGHRGKNDPQQFIDGPVDIV